MSPNATDAKFKLNFLCQIFKFNTIVKIANKGENVSYFIQSIPENFTQSFVMCIHKSSQTTLPKNKVSLKRTYCKLKTTSLEQSKLTYSIHDIWVPNALSCTIPSLINSEYWWPPFGKPCTSRRAQLSYSTVIKYVTAAWLTYMLCIVHKSNAYYVAFGPRQRPSADVANRDPVNP